MVPHGRQKQPWKSIEQIKKLSITRTINWKGGDGKHLSGNCFRNKICDPAWSKARNREESNPRQRKRGVESGILLMGTLKESIKKNLKKNEKVKTIGKQGDKPTAAYCKYGRFSKKQR